MMRKLTLVAAIAAALSPLNLYALGLGGISTHSTLNQPLKADINLVSANDLDVEDIRVELASSEAFEKAGIDRPFILSGLRFNPAIASSGNYVISVTSRDAIREPFLNFLIEVNWPNGRLLREYTILLDPPVTLERRPAAIEAPKVSTAPAQQVQVKPANTVPVQRQPVPVAAPTQATGGREYGPVRSGETLWQIAKQMQAEGETTEQVVMALHRHNPDAFIRNNVNGLKKGKILRLPEGADVTSLSPREARQEFIQQTKEWSAPKEKPEPRESTPKEAVAKATETGKGADRLELVTAKPDKAEQPGGGGGSTAEGKDQTQLEQELLLLREENETSKLNNQALKRQIEELEGQIKDMQRLVTLKSDQLAEIHAAQQIAQENEDKLAEDATQQSSEAASDTQVEKPVEAAPAETPTISETTNQTVAEQPPPPQPAEPPAVKAKQGVMEKLLANPLLLGIIGAVGVLLGGLAWLVLRRRREGQDEFAESILITPSEKLKAASEKAKAKVASEDERIDETSFMTDFSPSDIDALQDDVGEVDPLSEADVYIAYGRYQQAEDMLRQAIDKAPERQELKHKLLEIYHAAKNAPAFFALASALHASGLEKSKPSVWASVVSMGRDLDPTHELIANAGSLADDDHMFGFTDDLSEFDLNLSSDIATDSIMNNLDATESEGRTEKVADEDALSFDLDELGDPFVDTETPPAPLELDEVEPITLVDSGKDEDEVYSIEGMDNDSFEVDLDDMETTLAKGSALHGDTAMDSLAVSSLDDELELPTELDEDVGDEAVGVLGLEESESLENLDLESLEKELEILSGDLAGKQTISDEAEDTSDSVLAGDDDNLDEVSTKLELARAYVDMGDTEGSESILLEVMDEGNAEQKSQAKKLLDNLKK